MHLRRVSAVAAMAVVAGITSTLGPAVSARASDSSVALTSLSDFGQMVAAPNHLFFTAPSALALGGTRSEDKVLVTDLDGGNATTVDNEPGAAAMALSADGSKLYVARSKDSSIAVIDTATLNETAHYSLGDGVTPNSVALTGGKIWFGYAKDSAFGIGSLDLGGDAPVVSLTDIPDALFAPNLLKAVPGSTSLVVVNADHSGSWVRSYDVSTGTPQALNTASTPGYGIPALDVTPDGQDVLVTWAGGGAAVFSTATMTKDAGYPAPVVTDGDGVTNSLAIGPDGTVALGVEGVGDVHTFAPRGTNELRSFGIGGGMPPRSVTWSADQQHLYTITADDQGGSNPVLHVLSDPELATTQLSASAPTSVIPGQQLAVAGRLASGWGNWADGTVVTVSRDGTVLNDAVPVNADGSYSFSDTPPTADDGTVYHYTVSYAGDARHGAAQAASAATVARTATSVHATAPSAAVPGRALTVTGFVTSSVPLDPGQTLSIGRNGEPFASVPLNADGSFSFTDTPTAEGTLSYSVSYPGDATHAPSSAYPSVTASKLSTVVSTTAPSSAARAAKLTVSGSLSASPYVAGEVVTVVKTDLAHPSGYTLTSAKVAANGSFAFSDTPQIGGTNSYRLSYAGDISHRAGSKIVAVAVSRAAAYLTLSTDHATYKYGQAAKVTAHLGMTYNSRKVAIYNGTKLLKTGVVDAHGNLTVSTTLFQGATFRAVFAGDYRYAPRTVGRSVHTYARVSEKLVGYKGSYYTSTTYNHQTYRVFHHSVDPGLSVAVAPNKAGRTVQFQLQVYYQGAWRTADVYSHALSPSSTFTLYEGGLYDPSHKWPFRIRAVYLGGKDTTNLNTAGSWQYFMVTK